MKKLFFALFLTLGLTAVAQENITEGKVTLKQTMSSDNEQVNAQLAMVGEMSTVTYFKGNKSRTEVSSAMTGSNVTIVDNDAKKGIVLMDNPMMGKSYTEIDLNNISEEDFDKVKVEKIDETKTILGYKCQGYKLSMEEQGVNMNMILFSTEALKIATDKTKFGEKVKGFPLFMEIKVNQMGSMMTIITEATGIDKEVVADDMFNLTPPKGFEKITPDGVD
ncbi:DUF4412 domain-containing protein [Winogradskyella sp. 3972H.M.0a.05]|uniref:DUF4412 domain-containing protein n=1 Tax=Winogradskyella sp. 3972H.M.0a.05 TaxID=2950277 RepID=UPI0033930D67